MSKTSKSVSNEGNYTEKLYRNNEVTPCVNPVVQAAVGEAKARLKKIEKDYQNTFKKYRELQRYKCFIERKGSEHYSRWVGYCINCCNHLLSHLQNALNMLNIEQAPQPGTETAYPCKKVLMLHGCKSLRQEKMVLQQKAEHKEPKDDKPSPRTIDSKAIKWEFYQIQREIPRISSKKHVHDMLSRVKETYKPIEEAIVGGAMVGNSTSQDIIRYPVNTVIKLLKKIIKEMEKERGERSNILQDKRKEENRYTEKMRHLHEKKEWLCEKWDDERKYILGLKNIHDDLEYFLPVFQKWTLSC